MVVAFAATESLGQERESEDVSSSLEKMLNCIMGGVNFYCVIYIYLCDYTCLCNYKNYLNYSILKYFKILSCTST